MSSKNMILLRYLCVVPIFWLIIHKKEDNVRHVLNINNIRKYHFRPENINLNEISIYEEWDDIIKILFFFVFIYFILL